MPRTLEDGSVVYTQDEVEAQIAEKNKGLEENRDKIRSELIAAKDALRGFDGIDAKEYKTLKAHVAELEQAAKAEKAGVTSDELKRLRNEVREDMEREYSDLRTSNTDLSTRLRSLQLDSQVKAEMAKAGARAERIDALFKLTADRYDLTDDGAPILLDRPGTQIDRYVTEDLQKEFPEFFKGSGSSGSGASKSAASGGGFVNTIPAGDNDAFLANAEAIIAGSVEVR